MIQAARQHKRETGEGLGISSLSAVERALGTVPRDPGVAGRIKPLLRALQRGEVGTDAVVQLDRALAEAMPRVHRGDVVVSITGWPAGFDGDHQARLLRCDSPPPFVLSAGLAAAIHHEFDGLVIAGRDAPSVLRAARRVGAPGGVEGAANEATSSRTKRPLVALLGRRRAPLPDPSGGGNSDGRTAESSRGHLRDRWLRGTGWNSICFVRAGISVIAVEADSERLQLARRNAEALSCGG